MLLAYFIETETRKIYLKVTKLNMVTLKDNPQPKDLETEHFAAIL